MLVISLYALLWLACLSHGFPVLDVSGTPYQVGKAVGTHFRADIQAFVADREEELSHFERCIHSDESKNTAQQLFKNIQSFDEDILQELKGIAVGARLNLSTVLIINTAPELAHVCNSTAVPDCSDLLINVGDGTVVAGHNEDNDRPFNRSYFLRAKVLRSNGIEESFTAFTYPATLPGSAYGFTERGFGFSCNAEFPVEIDVGGVPRYAFARKLLSQSSVSSIYETIEKTKSASGFAVNIFAYGSAAPFVSSFEIAPGVSSLRHVYDGQAYFHVNEYEELKVEQSSDPSSIHRMARFQEMELRYSNKDEAIATLRKVLGDTADKEYPIYRDGAGPDKDVITLSTVIVDMGTKQAIVYDQNPQFSSPSLIIDL